MHVMGVRVEHLGGQVHCPHCQGVVQTMKLAEEAPLAEPELAEPQATEPEEPFNASSPPASEFESMQPNLRARPVFTGGVFAIYALIFLVPYAIFTTVALLYLIFGRRP
jgi:hypothetical protein